MYLKRKEVIFRVRSKPDPHLNQMFLLSTWPAESDSSCVWLGWKHDCTLIEPYGLDQMYVLKGHLFINTSVNKTWMIFKPMNNDYFSFGIDKTIILTYNLTQDYEY